MTLHITVHHTRDHFSYFSIRIAVTMLSVITLLYFFVCYTRQINRHVDSNISLQDTQLNIFCVYCTGIANIFSCVV